MRPILALLVVFIMLASGLSAIALLLFNLGVIG